MSQGRPGEYPRFLSPRSCHLPRVALDNRISLLVDDTFPPGVDHTSDELFRVQGTINGATERQNSAHAECQNKAGFEGQSSSEAARRYPLDERLRSRIKVT